MVAPRCACGAPLVDVLATTGSRFDREYRLLRCGRCGLVSPDPFPTEAELRARYDRYGGYDDPSRLADRVAAKRYAADRLVARLERLLPRSPEPRRFLEVGCASGALLANLAERAELDCHGCEVDPASGALARSLLPGRIHTGTLASAGYPHAWFSVVYLEQVIEHVPDPGALLRECRRILEPGGLILLGTPNVDGLSRRLLGARWKEIHPEEHVRLFGPKAIRHHLAAAGFERIATEVGGISLLVAPDRKDLFPLRRESLAGRAVNKLLAIAGLGDNLVAYAFNPGRVR